MNVILSAVEWGRGGGQKGGVLEGGGEGGEGGVDGVEGVTYNFPFYHH